MSAIMVLTTVGDEEQAKRIAGGLVERRQAACVNSLPGVTSFYRWQGKVCHDAEILLVIKTTADRFEAVQETIQELHSYDLPEILAFEVARGEPGFLRWIADSVGG